MGELTNSYNSLSDGVLAKLSRNGDENAFNELVVRYLATISFIARKFSAQGYEQNDFVQEGLLGLLYSCQTFDENGASSFKTYMSVIVERRFISIIRRQTTQKAVPNSAIVRIDDLGEDVEDASLTPEEIVTYKEYTKSVLEKLKSMLSKTEYEVLIHFAGGHSYSQISQILNISEKSVDNALHRARKKICSTDMS